MAASHTNPTRRPLAVFIHQRYSEDMTTTQTTKTPGQFDEFQELADGSFVTHRSFQQAWVYCRVVTADGHARTRRYRHDQRVAVAA